MLFQELLFQRAQHLLDGMCMRIRRDGADGGIGGGRALRFVGQSKGDGPLEPVRGDLRERHTGPTLDLIYACQCLLCGVLHMMRHRCQPLLAVGDLDRNGHILDGREL